MRSRHLLARRYGHPAADAAAVERRDDVPVAFEWRGRHYAVTRVLRHWREVQEWWQARAVAHLLETATDDGAGACLDDGEQACWRVEARCASTGRVGVYDLTCDLGTGDWTVARTHD